MNYGKAWADGIRQVALLAFNKATPFKGRPPVLATTRQRKRASNPFTGLQRVSFGAGLARHFQSRRLHGKGMFA